MKSQRGRQAGKQASKQRDERGEEAAWHAPKIRGGSSPSGPHGPSRGPAAVHSSAQTPLWWWCWVPRGLDDVRGGGGAAWLRAAAAAGGGGEKLPCVTEWGLPKGRLVGAGCCSPLTGPQRSGRAARLRCQAPEAANSRAPRRGEGRGGGGTIRCTCHYKGSPMEGEGGGGIREGRKEGSERLQDWPILYKRRGPQHPFPAAVAAGEAERHTGRAARRAFG